MNTEPTRSKVGQTLRSHRMRAGLSQLELATRAAVGVRTLRNLEQGRVAQPHASSLRRLAEALELSGAEVDALLALTGSRTKLPDSADVRVAVLGPLAVWRGDAAIEIGSMMLRRLLGLLALQPDRVVLPEAIVEVLWEHDPPRSYRSLIQVYVGQLRSLLEPGRGRRAPSRIVAHTAGGYRLRLGPDRLDLARFDDLAGRGMRAWKDGNVDDARKLLDQALACWRGPVLGDLGERLRQHPVAVAVVRRQLAATLAYADLAVDPAANDTALARLRALAHAEPLHEGVASRLGLALARAGEQAAALALFDAMRTRLADELGIEPGAELRAAQLQVLRQQVARGGAETGPTPPRPTPAELPADVVGFTGRATHLDTLTTRLRTAGGTGPVVLAITGAGGVGKTALAVHWAHQVRDEFPDGQLYVDLRGFAADRPMRPIEALTRFLRALGCALDQAPVDPEQAAAMYRSLVAGRRVLVVLDNARDAEQVRPLLPGSTGCLAVVTSRDRLTGLVARNGAFRIPVDVLTTGEADTLLERLIGADRVGAEPDAAAALVELCGRQPLALRIAAANVTGRAGGLAAYTARLRTGNRLAMLAADDDQQAAVRATFDLSYAALSKPERRLFRLLGLNPGTDITPDAAAALIGATPDETTHMLDRLSGAHLVDERAAGRYGMHDLLRIYATERAAGQDGDLGSREATARLFGMYLHTADAAARMLYPHMLRLPLPPTSSPVRTEFRDHAEALDWLDAERHNLVAVVERAAAQGPHPIAWLLADVLHGYFWLRMFTVDWLATAESGLAAARASGEPRPETACQLSLANAWMRQSQYPQAIGHASRALDLATQIGWPQGQAAAANNLGLVYWQSGRLQQAVAHLTHALTLNRQAGHSHGEAANLGNLSIIHGEMGRLRASVAYVTSALAITRRIRYPVGEANGLTQLGKLAHDLGRFDSALHHLTVALRLQRELGNRGGEADTLCTLAQVHRDAGRGRDARAPAEAAVALAADAADRQVEATALNTLATIELRLGHHQAAVDRFRQALSVAVTTGNRYPEIEALIGLADCHRQQASGGTEAVEYARQALDLSRQGGYQVLEAHALIALAAADLALRRVDRALPEARQAVSVHQETGHRLGQARAHLLLGHACWRAGLPGAAETSWHRAHTLFTEIRVPEADHVRALQLSPNHLETSHR